jgi:hypothetical protein
MFTSGPDDQDDDCSCDQADDRAPLHPADEADIAFPVNGGFLFQVQVGGHVHPLRVLKWRILINRVSAAQAPN